MGKGTPAAAKKEDQEETEGGEEKQEYGQTQLSEGGWYFSSGPSPGSLEFLFSELLLSLCRFLNFFFPVMLFVLISG